uniref:Uncharacterized protein n=1 Tax=Arundo donax TaxID=35708 RepID=A0A0A9CTE7_ARUDO
MALSMRLLSTGHFHFIPLLSSKNTLDIKTKHYLNMLATF